MLGHHVSEVGDRLIAAGRRHLSEQADSNIKHWILSECPSRFVCVVRRLPGMRPVLSHKPIEEWHVVTVWPAQQPIDANFQGVCNSADLLASRAARPVFQVADG